LFSGGKSGAPAATTGNSISADAGGIKFGIWLDGKIYSRAGVIPESHRADLSEKISAHLKQNQTDFLIWPAADPHRVFLQSLNAAAGLPAAYQVCLYSLAESLAAQRDLKTRILIFGGLTLLGAFFISLVLANGLSVPLRELAAGANEIQRGNFAVKVRVRSRDDIGKLASSFNDMADGLALKEKYRKVLNLVSDEKVAQQLINNQAALGGELREVTALFCDVRGFTALTQNMPPEEVIEMLNEHMTVLARVVKKHNGVVDKFVGDALMATFGAPISYQNDALDGASAALAMIIEREKLNETSKHKLRIGVGVATGKMVAGCMGSTDRLNYTVLGERVNLAARLCSQAKAGQVVIDQTTRERLGNVISVVPTPELHLKGFSENVTAYALHRVGNMAINPNQT
jgi:class 3 adenylate cyclase